MTTRSFSLRVAQRGQITLPQAVREMYGIRPGQEMTLIDFDGYLVLRPRASRIDPVADKLAQRGASLETVLETVREVRAGDSQQEPEAIESEAGYEAALALVAELMDAAPGSPEEEELELLSSLVERYEQEHFRDQEWTSD